VATLMLNCLARGPAFCPFGHMAAVKVSLGVAAWSTSHPHHIHHFLHERLPTQPPTENRLTERLHGAKEL
jgi:hypothetical protein